jgi:hypothetical protein
MSSRLNWLKLSLQSMLLDGLITAALLLLDFGLQSTSIRDLNKCVSFAQSQI